MRYCRLKQAHMPHFEICNHTGHSVWPKVGTFQDEASFNPAIPEELAAAEAKHQALVAEGYTPPIEREIRLPLAYAKPFVPNYWCSGPERLVRAYISGNNFTSRRSA
jgi:hypothetical protein